MSEQINKRILERLFPESRWSEVRGGLTDGLSIGAMVGGVLAGVITGLGLGIGLAIFIIGAVWKLLTANVW